MVTTNNKPLSISYIPLQNEIFWNVPPGINRTVVHKGRRIGFTHGCANYSCERLLEGAKMLWIDTTQNNLNMYFDRYFMPILKQIDRKHWHYSRQEKTLHLFGGIMDFRSAERPENMEGQGYDEIIINEAGIVLSGMKGRKLWGSTILPMAIDTNARIIIGGTPKGKRAKKDEKHISKFSLYYELSQKYKTQDTWRSVQFKTRDNPLLSKDGIREVEIDIPDYLLPQEMDGEFIDITGETIFKRYYVNRIVTELPDEHLWQRLIISCDTAFKKGAENDDCAFILLLETNIQYYIIDMVCEKMEFPELIESLKIFINKHDGAYHGHEIDYILIEDKASGTPLIQMLREEGLDIVEVGVSVDKVSRANACVPTFQNRMVSLLYGEWNDDFIDQMCEFSNLLDTPDDIVDATTQVLNYLNMDESLDADNVFSNRISFTKESLRGYIN